MMDDDHKDDHHGYNKRPRPTGSPHGEANITHLTNNHH